MAETKKQNNDETTKKTGSQQEDHSQEQGQQKEGAGSEDTGQKTESTEERIRKFGDRLSEAADRGVDIAKDVYGKVVDFSTDASELTRLKFEIRRHKTDRENLLKEMGEKLWGLKKENKFRGIQKTFEEDFEKLNELEKIIAKKEDQAKKISFS